MPGHCDGTLPNPLPLDLPRQDLSISADMRDTIEHEGHGI